MILKRYNSENQKKIWFNYQKQQLRFDELFKIAYALYFCRENTIS